MSVIVKYIPDIHSPDGREETPVEWELNKPVSEYVKPYYREGMRVISSAYGHLDTHQHVLPCGAQDQLIVTPLLGKGGGGGGIFKSIGKALSLAPFWYVRIFNAGYRRQLSDLFAPAIKQPGLASPASGGSAANSAAASPTYAWNGISTQADVGIPLQLTFGTHFVGGNIINAFIDQDGDHSYLNVQLALGEGPYGNLFGITADTDNADIDDIGDMIMIEGNPINLLTGSKVMVRMGTDTQNPMNLFHAQHNLYSLSNIKLQKGVDYIRTTEKHDVQAVYIIFRFQSLIAFDKEDGSKKTKYRAKIYYRIHGSGDGWTLHGEFSVEAKTNSELRRPYTVDGLAMGKYDIRIVQQTPNSEPDKLSADCYVMLMDEQTFRSQSFPNVVLVGLRLLATNRLSGTLSTMLFKVIHGMKCKIYSDPDTHTFESTNNPIWVMNEIATNRRWGLGRFLDKKNHNITRLINRANYCDELIHVDGSSDTEKRFVLDVVVDSYYKALDLLLALGATFRCIPMWISGQIDLWIEKPEPITQVFTMGSIIKGSLKQSWPRYSGKINQVEVQFLDADNLFARDSITVVVDGGAAPGKPIRKKVIFARGITRRTQAARLGRFILNSYQFADRELSLRVMMKGLGCTSGDVVAIAHDVPRFGVSSGRVLSGTTDSITLQKHVSLTPLQPGESWVVTVAHKADDTIETQTLNMANGNYDAGTALSIIGNFDRTPEEYDDFVVGVGERQYFPARVVAAEEQPNWEIGLSLREYNEDVLSDNEVEIEDVDFSNLPSPDALPSLVTNVVATSPRSYYPIVEISYTIPELDTEHGFWEHAEIYVSTDGVNFQSTATSETETAEVYNLKPNIKYWFKVISVSTRGIHSKFTESPTIEYTPLPGIPPNVLGLELKGQGNDTIFKARDAQFEWQPATTTSLAPLGEEPNGFGGGNVPEYVRGYVVKICKEDPPFRSSISRLEFFREEHINTNYYNYTYDKNGQDHVGKKNLPAPTRRFTLFVWVEDVFGQISEYPAIITVSNPQPAAVTGLNFTITNVYSDEPANANIQDIATGNWNASPETDIDGYIVLLTPFHGDPENPPIDADSADYLIVGTYNTNNTPALYSADYTLGNTWHLPSGYHFWVAPYDQFSASYKWDDLNWAVFHLPVD